MTGGIRGASNWGGLKGFLQLRSAYAQLGEHGDVLNDYNLGNKKSDLLFKHFQNGTENHLYDALYRLARKGEQSGFTKEDAINAIDDIRAAKEIYNKIFDKKSPISINAFGLEYDLGRGQSLRAYSKADKRRVFENALDIHNLSKRNDNLKERKETYLAGQEEGIDNFYTT